MPPTHPHQNIFLKSPYFSFNVESVATVKGLKKVSHGDFPNTTMKKITSANESDIDSLEISVGTKTAFHTAIADGKTIFTPTKPVTYGEWQGLFYITTNFNDEASYIIGEGLNGGYTTITVEQWQSGFKHIFRTYLLPGLTASITSPRNGDSFIKGKEDIHFAAHYTSPLQSWVENIFVGTKYRSVGTLVLKSEYGTTARVSVNITLPPNPLNINKDQMYSGCGKGKGNCNSANRKASDIKQIVLHFTVDGSADQTKKMFYNEYHPDGYTYEEYKNLFGVTGVSAHYIIDRDGKIYQLVDDKNLAWHAGCRSHDSEGDCDDSYGAANTTIGIELNNWGPLTYNDVTETYTSAGGRFTPTVSRKVYDNGSNWHNKRYWEDTYSEQVVSLKNLIEKLTDDYAVEKVVYEQDGIKNIMDYVSNETTVSNFNGILGHSIIADYKQDPGPAIQKALFNFLGI